MEYSQKVRHTFLERCIESSNLSIPDLIKKIKKY